MEKIFAQIPSDPPTGDIPSRSSSVFTVLNSLINWAFYIILFAAVLMIVAAAFVFLTAAGDQEKTSKARGYILYAIIAVVIAFLAKAIVALVANILGVENVPFF